MGATNSVQVLQGNVSFILQDEMPDVAAAFMDDINIKGPPTCDETTKGGWYTSMAFSDPPDQSHPVVCAPGPDGQFYEVLVENPGIHCFIWEHIHILQLENGNLHTRSG